MLIEEIRAYLYRKKSLIKFCSISFSIVWIIDSRLDSKKGFLIEQVA